MDINIEERPNYYSVIPATVRYDKDLTARDKLLYGEITALCSKTGECWASNEYFAKLYNVSTRSIRTSITNLVEKGYLDRKIFYKNNSKEIEKRIITLGKNLTVPYGNFFPNPGEEIFLDNNTSINNTSINKKEKYIKRKSFKKPTIEEIKSYCEERKNNIDAEVFFDFYESKGWVVGKSSMKDWKAAIRTWERSRKNAQSPKPKESKPIYQPYEEWIQELEAKQKDEYKKEIDGEFKPTGQIELDEDFPW